MFKFYTCLYIYIYIYIYLVTFSFSIFSVYLHTVLMAFIVYSNWILFWHTVSVRWRDANILVLPRHHRFSIDFICICIIMCMYICVCIFTYIYMCIYIYIYVYIFI